MVGFFTFTIFINANIFLSPFYSTTSSGVLVHQVSLGPTMFHLSQDSVIIAINGTPILNTNSLTLYMWNTKPNQTLYIITDSLIETILFHLFPIKTWVNTFIGPPLPYDLFPLDSIGALGVGVSDYFPANGIFGFLVDWLGPFLYFSIIKTISWVFILSLGIALFNLLPIPLFDGDKILVTLVNKLMKNQSTTTDDLDETNSKNNNKKRTYTKKDIIINAVRIYALFLLFSSVIITVINIILGNFNLSSFLG